MSGATSYCPRTPNPYTLPRPDPTIKRLIVCCDGTWKSSDRGHPDYPSNITRLTRAINCVSTREGLNIQQIVYYQSGLGTGDQSKVGKLTSGDVGVGLDDNVRDTYTFLANNYQGGDVDQPADEIFLFRFSRGAYIVCALSGVIAVIGILMKRGMDQFPLIWAEYKKGLEEFNRFMDEAQRQCGPNRIPFETQRGVVVKVIGCFE